MGIQLAKGRKRGVKEKKKKVVAWSRKLEKKEENV